MEKANHCHENSTSSKKPFIVRWSENDLRIRKHRFGISFNFTEDEETLKLNKNQLISAFNELSEPFFTENC
jgi:hypothetical protein